MDVQNEKCVILYYMLWYLRSASGSTKQMYY
jgi:hypothetical protein